MEAFVMVKNGIKQCPPGEWIDKMWHINGVKCYSAIESNEVLTHATTCVNLENMLSHRSSHT